MVGVYIGMNDFDIGKDLQDAYNQGYKDGLTDLENEIENKLSKANWYSKGRILRVVKNFLKDRCRT